MEISIMVMWLVAGVILFLAEMLLPGIGLMFAGLAALTVGMLLNFSIIAENNHILQTLVFLVATAIWAALLWKPIQKLKLGKSKGQYSNIIGEAATVGKKGVTKNDGEVVWSGSLMKAKLTDNSSVEKLEAGEIVVIKDINGNVLSVTPK